ncbi:MAG TPA: hypothetical protein VJ123_01970 [Anaerolineales bacterium]|nr:hypothetical protein [Anaerolineales bacterium]
MDTFIDWYERQNDAVKAAVITASIGFVGLFVTGCFACLAALVSRPATSEPKAPTPVILVITAVPVPTSPPLIRTPVGTPSSSLVATAQPTPTSTPRPPEPVLTTAERYLNLLPPETHSLVLGTLGASFIVLAVLLAIRIARGDKDPAILVLVLISIIVCVRLWRWWGLLLGPIAGVSIVGIMAESIYAAGITFGAMVGALLGIGASLLYLAIPGPLITAYVVVGTMVFGIGGAIVGLIISGVVRR